MLIPLAIVGRSIAIGASATPVASALRDRNVVTTPIVTATLAPLPAGVRFAWEVEEFDVAGNPVPGTKVSNPAAWWPTPTINAFNGYNGTSTLGNTSSVGSFKQGHRYRITRGLWAECNPWTPIVHSVFMSTP
jgi:hypothetical protein